MPWERHACHAQVAAQLATAVLNARPVILHTSCKMASAQHHANLEVLPMCSIIIATVSTLISHPHSIIHNFKDNFDFILIMLYILMIMPSYIRNNRT